MCSSSHNVVSELWRRRRRRVDTHTHTQINLEINLEAEDVCISLGDTSCRMFPSAILQPPAPLFSTFFMLKLSNFIESLHKISFFHATLPLWGSLWCTKVDHGNYFHTVPHGCSVVFSISWSPVAHHHHHLQAYKHKLHHHITAATSQLLTKNSTKFLVIRL